MAPLRREMFDSEGAKPPFLRAMAGLLPVRVEDTSVGQRIQSVIVVIPVRVERGTVYEGSGFAREGHSDKSPHAIHGANHRHQRERERPMRGRRELPDYAVGHGL